MLFMKIRKKTINYCCIFAICILLIILSLFCSKIHHNYVLMNETVKMQIETIESLQDDVIVLQTVFDKASERAALIDKAAHIIREIQPKHSARDAIKLATKIYDECEELGLSYSFTLAIIAAESRFEHKAVSAVGAQGIMQIMPLTFVGVARLYGHDFVESDVRDLNKNIKIGVTYLHRLQQKNVRFDLTAAGYNGGQQVASNYKANLVGDSTSYVPAETNRYVKTVMNYYYDFKSKIGK